jgi:hypothetical protein
MRLSGLCTGADIVLPSMKPSMKNWATADVRRDEPQRGADLELGRDEEIYDESEPLLHSEDVSFIMNS